MLREILDWVQETLGKILCHSNLEFECQQLAWQEEAGEEVEEYIHKRYVKKLLWGKPVSLSLGPAAGLLCVVGENKATTSLFSRT